MQAGPSPFGVGAEQATLSELVPVSGGKRDQLVEHGYRDLVAIDDRPPDIPQHLGMGAQQCRDPVPDLLEDIGRRIRQRDGVDRLANSLQHVGVHGRAQPGLRAEVVLHQSQRDPGQLSDRA